MVINGHYNSGLVEVDRYARRRLVFKHFSILYFFLLILLRSDKDLPMYGSVTLGRGSQVRTTAPVLNDFRDNWCSSRAHGFKSHPRRQINLDPLMFLKTNTTPFASEF